MAVIPPDAGVRMRLQTDASLVQPLQPVKPIPDDLPDLQPGQTFTARIVETLPGNSYRAMVAGRQLTLQLPEGAEAGDTLELVVIDRTPKAVVAQRAGPQTSTPAAGQPYPYARISTAGRMIGELVLADGETPQPAPLNRGQPLLPQPPTSAADLAPALEKAVSQSGLFYESHQAQWLAGQRPVESLRAEPQGRLPVTNHPAAEDDRAARPLASTDTAALSDTGQISVSAGDKVTVPVSDRTAGTLAQTLPNMPEEIRPIVQQQLDAVVTQRLAWHGEAWPGQGIDWEVERESVDDGTNSPPGDDAPRWKTTLRLTMPNLGTLDATLQLSGEGLRLRMLAANGAAADDLRRNLPQLAQALAAAGMALQSAEVHSGFA